MSFRLEARLKMGKDGLARSLSPIRFKNPDEAQVRHYRPEELDPRVADLSPIERGHNNLGTAYLVTYDLAGDVTILRHEVEVINGG